MANSVDLDETPRSAASHLGLYCLLRPVCPNIYGKYGIYVGKAIANCTGNIKGTVLGCSDLHRHLQFLNKSDFLFLF